MKNICFKPVSFLIGLTALTLVGSAMSARAETPSTDDFGTSGAAVAPIAGMESAAISVGKFDQLTLDSTSEVEHSEPSSLTVFEDEPAVTPVATLDPPQSESTVTQMSQDKTQQRPVYQADSAPINEYQAQSQQIPLPKAIANNQQASSEAVDSFSLVEPILGIPDNGSAAQPIPGTLATSADPLINQPTTLSQPEDSSAQTDTHVAQFDVDVEPGRTTRGGQSYIGIGANIGLGGDTGLGDGAFGVNAKIGLTPTISARPAVLFGDGVIFLLPVTYDFIIQSADPFEPIPFAPFLGGGVTFATGGDEDGDTADLDDEGGDQFGFLLTGGIDLPLSPQFVANATLNVGFYEETTDVGIMLGVGYTFPSLFR